MIQIRHLHTHDVLLEVDRDTLAGADLRGKVLLYADLRNQDLTGANLYGIDLGNADLSGARLDHACVVRSEMLSAVAKGSSWVKVDASDAVLLNLDVARAG